jgi:hypothetical protein
LSSANLPVTHEVGVVLDGFEEDRCGPVDCERAITTVEDGAEKGVLVGNRADARAGLEHLRSISSASIGKALDVQSPLRYRKIDYLVI